MHVLRLSIALALVVGCADGLAAPRNGDPHAVATGSCGPTDGAAIAIYLSPAPMQMAPPSAPFIGVTVFQPLTTLSSRAWSVGSGSADGFASFQSTDTNRESATSGMLTVTSVSADNHIEGIVDLTFPRGGRVRSAFKAAWIPQTFLCG